MFYPVLFLFSERVFSGLSVVMFPSAKTMGWQLPFPRLLRKSWIRKYCSCHWCSLQCWLWHLGRTGTGSLWSLPGASGSAFAWYDKWSKRIRRYYWRPGWIFPAGRGTDMSDGSGIFIENNVKISELVKISLKTGFISIGEPKEKNRMIMGHWRKMSGKVFLCKRTF